MFKRRHTLHNTSYIQTRPYTNGLVSKLVGIKKTYKLIGTQMLGMQTVSYMDWLVYKRYISWLIYKRHEYANWLVFKRHAYIDWLIYKRHEYVNRLVYKRVVYNASICKRVHIQKVYKLVGKQTRPRTNGWYIKRPGTNASIYKWHITLVSIQTVGI